MSGLRRVAGGPLTARQVEVLRLVANGNSAAEIGRWLWIEPCSVQTVLRNAYRALGVNDRAHAVAVAIRLGLIPLDDVHVPAALSASQGREVAADAAESTEPLNGAQSAA